MKIAGILFSVCIVITACVNKDASEVAAGENSMSVMYQKFYEVKQPTNNPPQAFGFNTYGCLDGAKSLPFRGKGFQVLRISLNRYYGHPMLIKFVKDFAKKVHESDLGNVLVGDISMPRGGPMHYGHFSHQNGLDVDFAFERISDEDKEKLTIHEMEHMKDKSVMNDDLTDFNPEVWDDKNIDVLGVCAEFKIVSNIYAHPLIVKKFCERVKELDIKNESWVAKVRPWYGHVDHYHVRLNCPSKKDNPDCISQGYFTKSVCDDPEFEEKWFSDKFMEKQKYYYAGQKALKDKIPEKFPEKCFSLLNE